MPLDTLKLIWRILGMKSINMECICIHIILAGQKYGVLRPAVLLTNSFFIYTVESKVASSGSLAHSREKPLF